MDEENPNSLSVGSEHDDNNEVHEENIKDDENIKEEDNINNDDNIKVEENINNDDNIKVEDNINNDENIKEEDNINYEDNVKAQENINNEDNIKDDIELTSLYEESLDVNVSDGQGVITEGELNEIAEESTVFETTDDFDQQHLKSGTSTKDNLESEQAAIESTKEDDQVRNSPQKLSGDYRGSYQGSQEGDHDTENVEGSETQEKAKSRSEASVEGEETSTNLYTRSSKSVKADSKMKIKDSNELTSTKLKPTQFFAYKPAYPEIIDPRKAGPCFMNPPALSVLQFGRPAYTTVTDERNWLNRHRLNKNKPKFSINPTASVPMRARRNRTKITFLEPPVLKEDWKEKEEARRDRKDQELAIELGYETLVGNVLYIPIPGAKDLNRSWENFLSPNEMEWGFPYLKGSKERPRSLPPPHPYLAFQLKEKLWKFPKTKIFHASNEDDKNKDFIL